jgi:hypothetical protein
MALDRTVGGRLWLRCGSGVWVHHAGDYDITVRLVLLLDARARRCWAAEVRRGGVVDTMPRLGPWRVRPGAPPLARAWAVVQAWRAEVGCE